MTLSKTSPDVVSAKSNFSLTDVLLYDHATLDSSCVAVWPKIWRVLREDPAATSVGRQDADLVIRKIVRNYSHVHQLHRLINKFLEALRSSETDLLPAEVVYPTVLHGELERCFLDTSEQQMSLVLGILLKELSLRLNGIGKGNAASLAKAVSQLTWTCIRNLRVKTTTRQEVLQGLCKQYLDMKDSIIVPLLQCARNLDSLDAVYCSAVLVHAWASFPLVFRDKYAVSMDEPLRILQVCLKSLTVDSPSSAELTSSHESTHTSELLYWRQKLLVLYFTISDFSAGYTASSLFNWPFLQSLSENSSWTESPFDITPETLPIALWSAICSNYTFLPEPVTADQHVPFAQFFVRSLTNSASSLHPGDSKNLALTVRHISEDFLEADLISGSAVLHEAIVQVLESSIKNCLDRTDVVQLKRSKKRPKQTDRPSEKARELSSLLRILSKIGFTIRSGVVTFSLSLVWKAFEFLLEHRTGGSSNDECLIAAESDFASLVLSVPSKDPKYWTNVLWDFCAMREKILQFDVRGTLGKILNQQSSRILLLIAESGSVDSLNLAFQTAKEQATFLSPLILDVLLVRLQQPGAVKLAHEVVGHLCESYIGLMSASTEIDQAALGACAPVSRSIQMAFAKLRKIGAKSFAETVSSLKKFLSSRSVSQTLDHAVESRHPIQLEMALSHLALFIEVRGSCKLKVVQRVLSLFRPRDSVDCAKERAEVTEAGDLSGLDDAALYRRLVTISQDRCKSKIADPEEKSSLTPLTNSLVVLFRQFGKYCKPVKLARVVKEALKTIATDTAAGRTPIEWNLLLCKLVVSLKQAPAMSKVFAPLDELILECLSSMLVSTSSVVILSDAMTLLQILLRSQRPLEVCRIALSRPVYECLLRSDLSDTDFTSLFEKCSILLSDILMQPHLVTPQTLPVIINATSIWLISILQRARQSSSTAVLDATSSSRKSLMIRNSSFVERLLGNFAKHQRAFSKLVIHLVAVYCHALQNGALYPEAKEHIVAGLYRLLDGIDPHSRSMGSATMSVESREIYKTLVEDHQRFHKYRGLV